MGRGRRARPTRRSRPRSATAVRRARDAGAHVVLASGRSPHGMTPVADLLELHLDDAEPLWIVASNGAVVFRYPPLDVVVEETFDAAPAVRAILERHPTALVAVEERGVGYRVTKRVPDRRAVRRDDRHRRRGPRRRAGQPGDHPRPRRHRRRLRRAGPGARPARHRLRRRLDRLARPRPGRGLQGLRPGPRRRAARRRPRPTCWPSATAATTSRCSSGPAAGWPWARRSSRCTTPPTTSTAPVAEDGAARRAGEVLLMLPEVVEPSGCGCRCGPRTTSRGMRAGARRPGWHPEFPREDDRDAASMWHEGDPWWAAVDRARRRGGRLDRLLRPAASRPTTACPRPRSATAWSRTPAAPGWPPRRSTAMLAAADAARRPGPGQRAARQRGEHPGARQVRLHRAARQQRGRRARDGAARCR